MHEVRSIQDLLNQIGRDEILLPEFQRGYVWNRNQVRGLMQSLYRKHPTGHLLIWRTYKPSLVRGGTPPGDGHSLLLLDGQQRLTTLYVLFHGKAPRFYEGESLFFDLYFNMQTMEFRFWQKSQMESNPAWISVHDFLREGLNALLERLDEFDENRQVVIQKNLARLSRLDKIRDYTYTVDQVSGDDFGVDEVVEIFNRINSKGTPLKKADLALAHVCSLWPEARMELREFGSKMTSLGFDVDLNFLVRCLAGAATGSILLEGSFLRATATALKEAWEDIRPALEHLVGVLKNEAFVTSLDDLPTNYVLIPATIYLARQGGEFPSDSVRRRFIRWIFLAGLWTRYSGSSDTKLQQDVALVTGTDPDPTHELEEAIKRDRGRVALQGGDLAGAHINSAVARLTRIVARQKDARDWFTGMRIYDPVSKSTLGEDRHYIFPKRVLQKVGLSDSKRFNDVANRVILTEPAPKDYRSLSPIDYLEEVERDHAGALAAQSVPLDRSLWHPERFLQFLVARQQLLAEAVNGFIEDWLPEAGADPEQQVRSLISAGESEVLEFKSSLRWDHREERVNKALERVVVKTIAGFLNFKGGTLLIGVEDGRSLVGLARDFATLKGQNRDGFELHLRAILIQNFGEATSSTLLRVNFHEIDGHEICQIVVDPSDHPIYVEHQGDSMFYLRTGNATKALPVKEAVRYVGSRWGGQ